VRTLVPEETAPPPWLLTWLMPSSTINGILAMTAFKEQFSTGFTRDGQPSISPSQTAIIVAILSAGTLVGALIAAPVGDYWGRRKSLIGAVTAFNFGVIFQVCAQAIPMLVAGRYVGFGGACKALSLGPVFLAAS
jgi:MFS family permease